MKFKNFIVEEQLICEGIKEDIIVILDAMTDDELEEFGDWLASELDEADFGEYTGLTKEEIIEILGDISSEDLDYVLFMLLPEEEWEEEIEDSDYHTEENPNIDEAISKILKAKKRNKGIKRFTKSKAELRRGMAQRKKENRLKKVQKKKYKRQNRVSLKKYAKSYATAVKKGLHKKKIRRG